MRRTYFAGSRQENILEAYEKWWPLTFSRESLAWATLYRLKGKEVSVTGLRGKALRGPLAANGGTIELVDGQLIFIFDETTLARLIDVFGPDVPAAVAAEPLLCIPLPPIVPTLGGFIDPDTGQYCRPEAVLPEWECALGGPIVDEPDLSGARIGQRPPPPPGVCCQKTADGGSVCSNGLVYNPG